MGLFKPAWQSNDPQKRIKAAAELNDQEILKKLAATDPVLEVRLAALAKITDEAFLVMLVNEMNNKSITNTVIDRLTSTELLFMLAVQGKSRDIVERSAIKLARMGDKRVIIYFGDMKNCGIFFGHGSSDYEDFIDKIIGAAENIPCEETVDFLEKYYIRGNSSRAYQAQKALRLIRQKAQGTLLAERINKIKDLDTDITFNIY